jgi:protein-tyrosine-phosphatase
VGAPSGSAERKPEREKESRVTKILFVCTANICRSPMAQAIFNALAEDTNVPFRAESAGTAALEGKPMAENAIAALEEVGIYPGIHRARQVTSRMLDEYELVLTMSPQHTNTLRRLEGSTPQGVYTLPEYATGAPPQESIPDPYGHTMSAFRSTVRQLYDCVERVAGRLG